MKVDKETFQQIKNDLIVIVDQFGYKKLKKAYLENKTSVAIELWFSVHANRALSDNNPNVTILKTGRLLSYQPEHQLYPCCTTDRTIKTALVKALDKIFGL